MIYIDPPYGIQFGSNWQVSTRKRDVRDGRTEDTTRQPEQIRAFRDTWELGIHSYLAYWRDRLVAARELLTDAGSIFVQIGDENLHLVRSVLDEVFGADNYVSTINYTKTSGQTAKFLSVTTDYILWYAKNADSARYRALFTEKALGREGSSMYQFVELPDGYRRRLSRQEIENPGLLPEGARAYRLGDITSQRQGRPSGPGSAMYFPVKVEGRDFYPAGSRGWTTTAQGLQRAILAGRLVPQGERLSYMRYLEDFTAYELDNNWTDTAGASDRIYVVQTNQNVIGRCLAMCTQPGDLVLDPTCGSGTAAYVAEQWGRRWITVDTSRVALALARTRLMAGRFPYYLLSDSPEGLAKETQITGAPGPSPGGRGPGEGPDIRKGFVCKRVPHIQLKDIANNDEIDAIHEKWQPRQDVARKLLNEAIGTHYQEWEVPREPDKSWPKEARDAHKEFYDLRRKRQAEMDASIARHAGLELLYDQPYEDNKRVRVTGPFTVESLSPHRRISVEEKVQLAEAGREGWRVTELGPNQFGNIIIENLKASGVSNRAKGERLRFDRLEPFAGMWIHAAGEYTDKGGKSKRVAVCIGPEHGTVGPQLIKEAAKEAVQGIGFDLLIVLGFAFDPHVSEESKRYGKLTVLPAEIDKDLQLGGDFLRKSGSASLFTVYAEPDIEIIALKEDKIQVKIKGLDVYDPTTGEIRSNTTDDIACWFIDTDYNGESFFVRHAYFCGGEDPYEKLRRTLRAEIDEAAWSSLYSTVSRPFDKPESRQGRPGRIAVKVINHYGDEVLRVYQV